jgi:hypothetical protein
MCRCHQYKKLQQKVPICTALFGGRNNFQIVKDFSKFNALALKGYRGHQ